MTIAAQGRRYAAHVTKKRLDVLMVERGLAETRSQAQALVLAGKVPGHAKAGEQVDETTEIEVEPGPRFVSRGGEKLANALATFAVDVEGEDCLDVGASTGGFTDCLLQAGAARVCALDVGYGQLHPKLREDPRVTVMERMNVRNLDCEELPFRPTFVTCDVSFISLSKALPPALACAAAGLAGARSRQAAVRGGARGGRQGRRRPRPRGPQARRRRDRRAGGRLGSPGGGRRRLGPARPEGKP